MNRCRFDVAQCSGAVCRIMLHNWIDSVDFSLEKQSEFVFSWKVTLVWVDILATTNRNVRQTNDFNLTVAHRRGNNRCSKQTFEKWGWTCDRRLISQRQTEPSDWIISWLNRSISHSCVIHWIPSRQTNSRPTKLIAVMHHRSKIHPIFTRVPFVGRAIEPKWHKWHRVRWMARGRPASQLWIFTRLKGDGCLSSAKQ